MPKTKEKPGFVSEINRLRKTLKQDFDANPPEAVVKAATPASSPLHRYFEWDNGVAGHKYRLYQAGTMIRRCTFTIENPLNHVTYKVNQFMYSEDEFAATKEMLTHPSKRGSALETLAKDWEAETNRLCSNLIVAGQNALSAKIEKFKKQVLAELESIASVQSEAGG